MRIILLFLVIVFAALFKLGRTADTAEAVNPLRGEWHLLTLDDSMVDTADFNSSAPAITFYNTTATGFSGCNQIFADIFIKDGIVGFDRLKVTRVSCPELEFEQQLVKILGNSNFNFHLRNDILILANQEHILEFKRPLNNFSEK